MRLSPLLSGLLLCATSALWPTQSQAEGPPLLGRYMPLYPGQYLDLHATRDPGDESFAADGQRLNSALAQGPAGPTRLPRDNLALRMSWHFPFFETAQLPFISSRMWRARVGLDYARTETRGALAAFIREGQADAGLAPGDLRNNGSGIGNLHFALGSYLYGAPTREWRTGNDAPLAILAELALHLNVGAYDRDAPVSSGDNTPGWSVLLAAHAQPWRGAFVDAGVRQIFHGQNQDPAFGGLDPGQPGDQTRLDLSLSQRIWPGLSLTLYGQHRDGDPNRYDQPRFVTDPPSAPTPASDTQPVPAALWDAGTRLTSAGISLNWFATQRVRLSLSYTRPLSGRSGEIDVAHRVRTPAGCRPGTVGCVISAGDTVRTDGFGPGRVLASDQLSLSLSFQFLERDTFNCRGCSE